VLTPETARAIPAWRPDEAVQARRDALADKNTEGQFTDDEARGLKAIVDSDSAIGLMKAKAFGYLRRLP
jgi:glucuronate isomerase